MRRMGRVVGLRWRRQRELYRVWWCWRVVVYVSVTIPVTTVLESFSIAIASVTAVSGNAAAAAAAAAAGTAETMAVAMSVAVAVAGGGAMTPATGLATAAGVVVVRGASAAFTAGRLKVGVRVWVRCECGKEAAAASSYCADTGSPTCGGRVWPISCNGFPSTAETTPWQPRARRCTARAGSRHAALQDMRMRL